MNNYEHSYNRGEIYYINRTTTTGATEGRPAVIVSNNKNNMIGDAFEVVYLTITPKSDQPTHVTIRSTHTTSTALCERVYTVYQPSMGDYIGTCNESEMANIDAALMISLGIEIDAPPPKIMEVEVVKEVPVEVIKGVPVEVIKEVPAGNNEELIAARAQLAALQAMYDSLLERVMRGK